MLKEKIEKKRMYSKREKKKKKSNKKYEKKLHKADFLENPYFSSSAILRTPELGT